MGGTPSRYDDLSKNIYLIKFCGKETIAPNDEFWNKLLSFNIKPPVTRNDQIELDSRLDTMCQELLKNNLHSGNFGSLIQVLLLRASELLASGPNENVIVTWKTYNALFSIRCIFKYLVETLNEDDVIKHTEIQINKNNNNNNNENNITRLESFFEILIEIIIDLPLSGLTYAVHLEAINCLLVLLSVQLFSQTSAEYSIIYKMIMNNETSLHAPVIVCTLLYNFSQQEHAPPDLLVRDEGGSFVFSIAAGLWNVIRMGMGNSFKNIQVTNNGTTEEEEKKRDIETPLASQSLLLLLVLTNHCTTIHNPYRDALFFFTNANDNQSMITTKSIIPFRFNLDKLYNTICRVKNTDEVTLLMYMLLHRNQRVKEDIIKRSDIQLLVTPILQILYHAPDNTSHHIYMSLIILLILSEDESFNKRIHEIMLKNITWYTERCISEISLGGLLILVVIRTIQYNMLKMRDKYLHTNCLAALANMSAHFTSLHPYVSQRLLSLFETLAKKHSRLELQIHGKSTSSNNTDIKNVDINIDCNDSDLIQDLTILEEVLRMILEIINSCLTYRIGQNPNLIYTLLYKKDIFQLFKTHSAFQDIIQNIYSVINFFSHKLEKTEQSQIDVNEVLTIIKQGTLQWPKDRLRKFPELKFRYVEEEQPEEFFIPYVWSVVCQGALLYWSAENIKLFPLNNNEQTTVVVC